MRIASYNVEWFNALFDDAGRLLLDDEWSARYKITRRMQAEALGIVFSALDADAVLVVEAPDQTRRRSTVRALETFADTFHLRASQALIGYANTTQQEIALLYDPAALSARHDPKGDPTGKKGAPGAPRFDGVFRRDLDVDAAPDLVRFSKPPLELAITAASGARFRMIGVHIKSKAPHGAHCEDAAVRIAIENRRKQLAQCIWLRNRIDAQLAAGDELIVLGDFNDGPGLDEYEKLFGHSGVEIVLGLDGTDKVPLSDPHARFALQRHLAAPVSTARFYLPERGKYISALLDYIMLSPGLMAKSPEWRIWHPFDDRGCSELPELREALLQASDHFPVSLDIDL